jgi:heat-inducible transcriptional repressor
MELNGRKKLILGLVVESYIQTGEPVGSKAIASMLGLSVSPATIRNELADLETLGYLEQPHTSAGRVPTHRGYRLYVDGIMNKYLLSQIEKARIDHMLSLHYGDLENILEQAGKVLSEITNCVALSTSPISNGISILRLDLIPASNRSALIVLLTSSGIVKSRLARCEGTLYATHLEIFVNLCNDKLTGIPIETITPQSITILAKEFGNFAILLSPLLDCLVELIQELMENEVLVDGQSHLLDEFEPIMARDILKFLSSRNELSRLLSHPYDNTKILIGSENEYQPLQNLSLIISPYRLQGRIAGMVGLIAPTRINYPRMLSNIDYFASQLGRILEGYFGEY